MTHEDSQPHPDDTFKILIATDCHLGYGNSKIQGRELEDSFITFEEILQHAKSNEVDFILFGGDLFHDTRPSQATLTRCLELLRKYCLGPREHKIEFLTNPELIFKHCTHKTVNYEDPNFNIAIPVFSIHGNHDDPSFSTLGSMDMMAVTGFLNYFGKWTDLTQVNIPPIILKKGASHLALYGLSYINEQRLSRLFRDDLVKFLRPKEINDIFNIFVLHQNRARHSPNNYISERAFPNFLNLIVWGHEHECRVEPELIVDAGYHICQPGSSIATSLCQGESVQKHVALLKVYKNRFKISKIRLNTVRPFVFDDLVLSEQDIPKDYSKNDCKKLKDFVDDYIENTLMPKAAMQLTNDPKQPIEPLIRLRIMYSEEDQMFSTRQLSFKYQKDVANATEMIIFRKQGSRKKKTAEDADDQDEDEFNFDDVKKGDWVKTINGLMNKYYEIEENKNKLKVLSATGLNNALHRYVEYNDTDAFVDLINHQKNKIFEHLKSKGLTDPQEIMEEIEAFREQRQSKDEDDFDRVKVKSDKDKQNKSAKADKNDNPFDINDEDDCGTTADSSIQPTNVPSRGRGSRGARGGRGSRGPRAPRGSRGKRGGSNAQMITIDSD